MENNTSQDLSLRDVWLALTADFLSEISATLGSTSSTDNSITTNGAIACY